MDWWNFHVSKFASCFVHIVRHYTISAIFGLFYAGGPSTFCSILRKQSRHFAGSSSKSRTLLWLCGHQLWVAFFFQCFLIKMHRFFSYNMSLKHHSTWEIYFFIIYSIPTWSFFEQRIMVCQETCWVFNIMKVALKWLFSHTFASWFHFWGRRRVTKGPLKIYLLALLGL